MRDRLKYFDVKIIEVEIFSQRLKKSKVEVKYFVIAEIGENAIAGFSFAGLTFPGGELPVRLICQPYFCRWKIACAGLPVTHCRTFKFPVVVLPVTAIYQWSIAAKCNCRWYICQRKTIAFQERSKLLLCSYLFKR